MSMKKVKPLKKELPEPVIVVFPKGQKEYTAHTKLTPLETARILSNLAVNFAVQAGEIKVLEANRSKMISPHTGRPVINA